jgi:uncharacterized protein
MTDHRPPVLLGVVGSTSYGLSDEHSDQDRLGVFVASNDDVLGLDGTNATSASVVTKDPDLTLHEVGKFLSLCIKANPTVMELLWLDAYDVRTDAGVALIALREAVLSTDAVRNAYGGYAVSQARRLANRHDEGKSGFSADLSKRTAKHGRHCYRLLLQGRTLLSEGRLVVNVAGHRDEIFAAGQLAVDDPGGFLDLFESEKTRLDSTPSVLPDRPDRAHVSRVLVRIRRSFGGPVAG